MCTSVNLLVEVKCLSINLGVTIFFFYFFELETGIHEL